MSKHLAREALQSMNLKPIAIATTFQTLQSDLAYVASSNIDAENDNFMSVRRGQLAAAYGQDGVAQAKPFAFAQGIAIIPISGTLLNRLASSYGSYATGYNFISRQVQQAEADDDVIGIIFDVNSNGGAVAGCFECAGTIFAATKPTMALVDANCYSAAYALSSAANKIVCTPSGGAGSIGVVAMHVDMSGFLTEMGFKVTFIHAGAHKVDGNPFEPLSADVKKDIQASIDDSYDEFVGLVVEHRGLTDKAVRATEARTYSAKDALSLGLIDAIATPKEAFNAFLAELSGSTTTTSERKDAMSAAATEPGANAKAHTKEDLDAAASAARTAERQRVKDIQGSDEAKGKTKLANHLSMNTEMSVADAKAVLAAAEPEATSTTVVDPKANGVSPLDAAMGNTKNPEVGADGAAKGKTDEPEMSNANRILKAQALSSGAEFVPVKD